MYKKAWCTCKVLVLLIKPIVFFDVLDTVRVVGSLSPYYGLESRLSYFIIIIIIIIIISIIIIDITSESAQARI